MEENNLVNSEQSEYNIIRFEDEDIYLAPPVKNLSVDLFSHQLALFIKWKNVKKIEN